MIHGIARQMLGRLWWAFRGQVNHVTWSFFAWRRQSQLPQLAQGRIILAGRGDEAIGERMAVLRGASADQYRAWLMNGHWVLYAVSPDDDIQSWIWFTVAEGEPQIAPFDYGLGMKVPSGVGFLWDAFTVPAYRRQGLYKTLLMHAIEECFNRGAKQVWGHANVINASRNVILTTDLAGEMTITATRIGPFCRISGPGFHRTMSVHGILEMGALLPLARTKAGSDNRSRDPGTDVRRGPTTDCPAAGHAHADMRGQADRL
jgi:GNAT superfamily N-acetyltransferase